MSTLPVVASSVCATSSSLWFRSAAAKRARSIAVEYPPPADPPQLEMAGSFGWRVAVGPVGVCVA